MSLTDKLKEKEQENVKEFSTIFWKPKEGEVLEGKVEKIGQTITEFGDKNYLELVTDEGKKFTVFINAVLERLIEKEGVKKGDRVAIKYKGLGLSKKTKREFKDYILVKDKAGE